MKFGINSLNFTDTFVDTDLPLIEKTKRLGFDVLEISPTDPDRFPAAKVRQAAADNGISVNMNFALPPDANPVSPEASVRARAVELSRQVIDLANEAGAKIYCGANYCTWKYFTGKPRTEDEWKRGVDSYRQICQYALDTGDLILAVETLNRFESYFINTAADALRFVNEVGLDNATVHLDTFHMIREEDDMPEAIRATGSKLGYFHACGSQRGIPGKDLTEWRPVLEAVRDVGYDDCITIESFHPDLSIAPLVAVWRRFADTQEELATQGLAYLKPVVAEIWGP